VSIQFALHRLRKTIVHHPKKVRVTSFHGYNKSAGLAGVSSEMGLDDGLLVCTLLLLI